MPGSLALHRQFTFTERVNLQFPVKFFNIFNRPNLGSISRSAAWWHEQSHSPRRRDVSPPVCSPLGEISFPTAKNASRIRILNGACAPTAPKQRRGVNQAAGLS